MLNNLLITASRALVLGTLLLVAHPANAQPTLDIQGIDISIGMARSTVLEKLKDFRLSCLGEEVGNVARCSSLFVARKVSEEPLYESLANIYFVDNLVKSVFKYWEQGYEGSDPARFVETLYAALSNHERQGGKPFLVSVADKRDPGVYQQAIYLTSGRKTIEIIHIQGLRIKGKVQAPQVSFTETIK